MLKTHYHAIALLLALVMALSALYAFPAQAEDTAEAPEIPGLTFEGETELEYAQCFHLYRYSGGYTLISVEEDRDFLVVPEDGTVPEGLPSSIIVLQQPLTSIYMANSSAMSLFAAVDAVDAIRLSGTQASDWYVDAAVEAMESGEILFAGKYSEPDYELLVGEDCDLVVENTMIYRYPEVQEMFETLGIPLLVDRSSYEPHPLGRTEWIKLYAVLTDKEEEAAAYFESQAAIVRELENFENTGKTVAFFHINSSGQAVIRKPTDYIPTMISLAGGRYAFADLETEQSSTSFAITMEDFYAGACQADILIYNASTGTPITQMEELIAMDELFADFKAVQEGNVWCADKSLYQATDTVGQMIQDIHLALTGGDESEMTFLTRVQ